MQVIERLELFRKKILLLFILLSVNSFSQVFPDSSVHQLLKQGIAFIIEQKYDEAKNVFVQLDKSRSDVPLGKIYLAALQITKSYDYETPFNDSLISDYLKQAKNISEQLLEKDDRNIWNKYFFALTEGYTAYYDALRGSWLQAFSTGLNSIAAFEDCLEIDNEFNEAYIALGSYKFWKSKKADFLSWFPIIDDEKELGISYLKNAVKNSGYNSHIAIHSLIWIYIEQEEYDKAIETANKVLKEFPNSRIYKWGLARAYENIDPLKSAKLYKEILDSYPKNLISNKINRVVLKHLIAQQYVKVILNHKAIEMCDEILKIKDYTEFEFDKLENRLDRVRNLKKELLQN